MRIKPENFGACLQAIAERGRITNTEALGLLNEVANRGDQMRRTGKADPFVSAARDLAEQLKENAKADRADALRNAAIRAHVLDQVDQAGGLAHAETTLRSLLHGTNAGGRDSVQSMWRGNAAAWQAQLSFALRKAGAEKAAISGALDADISRELWAIHAGRAEPATGNNPARARSRKRSRLCSMGMCATV